jgi:hypothetical protein
MHFTPDPQYLLGLDHFVDVNKMVFIFATFLAPYFNPLICWKLKKSFCIFF